MPTAVPTEGTLPRILSINGGSSSIKVALFEAGEQLVQRSTGSLGGIEPSQLLASAAALDAQLQQLLQPMLASESSGGIAAIGHRVVHGGPEHGRPCRIDAPLLAQLRQLSPLAPEHMPLELALIEACARRFPGVPQVACFDTAFHHAMPRIAQLLAIPRRYQALGVRRYGFHGLSYEYLMRELAQVAGAEAAHGRVILAHLGNGASLAAVRHGRPVDTSMGFTPGSGLPMGSRCGDIDPGLVAWLARTEGMDADAFQTLASRESGLLGVSETSADMRELLAREAHDTRAAEAVALFCYQAGKWIGAFAAALGGLDTLVFAGGIGENQALIRERICQGLGFLGIELDPQANTDHGALISSGNAHVAVRVMHTDEALMIARSVNEVLALDQAKAGKPQ